MTNNFMKNIFLKKLKLSQNQSLGFLDNFSY